MSWHWKTIIAGAAVLGAATAAQAQAPGPADTSSVCFDAALFKKGVILDYDYRIGGGGMSSVQREVDEVGGTENFNGYSATEIKIKITGGFKYKARSYLKLTDSALVSYGALTDYTTFTIEPPERMPANLEKGGSLKQAVLYKSVFADGDKSIIQRKTVTTFEGVENITIEAGTFAACKFVIKTMERSKGASTYDTYTDTRWIAAKPPYRGFVLKTDFGSKPRQTFEVIRIRAFDLK